jgi:hypothetical protein
VDTAPDDIVIPALLRVARRAYGHAVRERVAEAGFDDMPSNGAFVVTERGRAAAGAVRAGVEQVDSELAHRLPSEQRHGFRAGLLALSDILDDMTSAEASA